MRRLIASLVTAASLALPVVAVAQPAEAAKVDCTIYIYKPTWFLGRGTWRPKTTPHGWKVSDWVDYCYGRMRPVKQGPNRPQGNWPVTIVLDQTCMWHTEGGETWLKDQSGWRHARINVTVGY